jgi:hypothetical protein
MLEWLGLDSASAFDPNAVTIDQLGGKSPSTAQAGYPQANQTR